MENILEVPLISGSQMWVTSIDIKFVSYVNFNPIKLFD